MKAIYFNGKEAEYRQDYKMPEPTETESLVKIELAAICNTDKEILKGYKPDFTGVMGHEFIGVVVTSPDPSLVGERVAGELNAGCGKCKYCRSGLSKHCNSRRVIGIEKKDGCFAEYMTIETDLLHVVPDGLCAEHAIFTEPLAAALEIPSLIHIDPDKKIAVLGDGRLALMIAQVIALTGASLTVTGRHEDKLALFSSFADVTTQIVPEGYDIVIDATGSKSGILTATQMVKKRGTIIIKSTYAGKVELDMSYYVVNEITITGSRCGPFEPTLNLLKKGYVTFPDIETYDLSEFKKAFSSNAFKSGFDFRK
ncbi:MAG: MDR/zinc-dependent alcohol dehydrogenase-like family protein [Lachnospiraceae bacterium]